VNCSFEFRGLLVSWSLDQKPQFSKRERERVGEEIKREKE
jgi:hypothetical protein